VRDIRPYRHGIRRAASPGRADVKHPNSGDLGVLLRLLARQGDYCWNRYGEHAEIPRNAHLRTVNPSANAYAGSNPAPATTAQTWYLATLALAKATAKGLVPASSQHSAQSHVLTAFAATTPPQSVITSSVRRPGEAHCSNSVHSIVLGSRYSLPRRSERRRSMNVRW